uniref:Calcineurin-like phosphoesterase domain-containing protein n=1 Tax=Ditylum brightwellii TaxID=49249 RepID=A0A7S2ECS7_9STRA|mmetsp:Transcript_23921/g.35689  ORF Transcript_23921/g.35689 Transcript_23921/m.35689 type:complete len:278 (+) Transcript_23921:95-928(+)
MDQSSPSESLSIQIVSDLHVEFYRFGIPDDIIIPSAPVLALLGDIGLACTHSLRTFLLQQSSRFQHVIFLAGNHEFYNLPGQTKSVSEQIEWMRNVCAERDNLHFLEQETINLNGVHICGATLWSDIPDEFNELAERSLNDYRCSYNKSDGEEGLHRLRATETTRWHKETVAWLTNELEESKKRNQPVLVLTHHTPKLAGTSHPRHDGSELTCCFLSELSHLLKSPVKVWACGHTHHNFSMTEISGARLVSNQRGYFFRVEKNYLPDGLVLNISSTL